MIEIQYKRKANFIINLQSNPTLIIKSKSLQYQI
jgi:hypothetical protein